MRQPRNVRIDAEGSRWRGWAAVVAVTSLLALLAPILGPTGTAGALPGDIGVEGAAFVEVGNPTESKPQSKVWFHDGSWWSVQVAQDGVDSMGRPQGSTYIARLNAVNDVWTKTLKIEDRGTAKSDVLANGNTLYIAIHKTDRNNGVVETTPSNKTRLYRFAYDTGSHAYGLALGFPKDMNSFEMESLTIDRSSSGTLWAGWVMGDGTADPVPPAPKLPRQVYTQSSTDDGVTWSTPVALTDVHATTSADDVASIVSFGTKVGVMWADQNPANDGFWFSVHDTNPAVGTWGAAEAAYTGANVGDDHVNLKAFNGQVFAAVKTRMDTGSNPLIVLLQRSAAGAWTRRTAWTGNSNVSRPLVEVNATTSTLRLFATGPLTAGAEGENGGGIFSKSVPIGSGVFAAGLGTAVMRRDGAKINNVSGSKAPVTSATGEVVLAADGTTKHYWHHRSSAALPAPTGSQYVAINPCRVVDTRSGAGGAFAAGQQRSYQVGGAGAAFAAQGGQAGGCGVPDGASAVAASVTAVAPGGNGFFRAWPAGSAAPNATFLNYTKGQSTTNTGAIALAATGAQDLTVKNFAAGSHYVIDIQGYYADPDVVPIGPAGSVYVAINPCRVIDTRSGGGGSFGAGQQRSYQVGGAGAAFAAQGGRAGGCAIPDAVRAVEASVTAVSPGGTGFFRAWPNGATAPNATFLNYTKGQSTTNTGAIALAASGVQDLTVKNFAAATHYVVDIQGYFVKPSDVPGGAIGSAYFPISPCRVIDTRSGGGGVFGADQQRSYQVAGVGAAFATQGGHVGGCTVPDGAEAVSASVTAVAPGGNGFFRAWPAGATAPNATFLNYTKGQSTTNTGAIALAPTGLQDLTVKNLAASSNYVVDVQGYYLADGA